MITNKKLYKVKKVLVEKYESELDVLATSEQDALDIFKSGLRGMSEQVTQSREEITVTAPKLEDEETLPF